MPAAEAFHFNRVENFSPPTFEEVFVSVRRSGSSSPHGPDIRMEQPRHQSLRRFSFGLLVIACIGNTRTQSPRAITGQAAPGQFILTRSSQAGHIRGRQRSSSENPRTSGCAAPISSSPGRDRGHSTVRPRRPVRCSHARGKEAGAETAPVVSALQSGCVVRAWKCVSKPLKDGALLCNQVTNFLGSKRA